MQCLWKASKVAPFSQGTLSEPVCSGSKIHFSPTCVCVCVFVTTVSSVIHGHDPVVFTPFGMFHRKPGRKLFRCKYIKTLSTLRPFAQPQLCAQNEICLCENFYVNHTASARCLTWHKLSTEVSERVSVLAERWCLGAKGRTLSTRLFASGAL